MKNKMYLVMDADDEKAVDIIKKLGFKEEIAKTLWFFQVFEEGASVEVERVMGLSQPRASTGINFLLKNSILRIKYGIHDYKRGRPKLIYIRYEEPIKYLELVTEKKITHQQTLLTVLKQNI